MSILFFRCHDIHASYGEDGFKAYGEMTDFNFINSQDVPLPELRGLTMSWSISANGENAWDNYVERTKNTGADLTLRKPAIQKFYKEGACGLLQRWDTSDGERCASLEYWLPPDPALTSFIMSLVAAKSALGFRCEGIIFTHDGREDAPAPSVSGFMNREEPLFLNHPPNIGV